MTLCLSRVGLAPEGRPFSGLCARGALFPEVGACSVLQASPSLACEAEVAEQVSLCGYRRKGLDTLCATRSRRSMGCQWPSLQQPFQCWQLGLLSTELGDCPSPSGEILFGLIAPVHTSGILRIAPTVSHPLDLRRPRVVPELAGPRLAVQRDIRRNAATLLVFTSQLGMVVTSPQTRYRRMLHSAQSGRCARRCHLVAIVWLGPGCA